MIKKALLFGICLFFLTANQISSAWACSGYPYFGVNDLPTMELLVRATVIDTDDRGYSAILRVEEYYKGDGARLLTVMRYPPALESGAGVRGYDTSCLYAGRGHVWVKGSQGYFGLMSNGDGTFTDNNGGTAHFYPVNGLIQYQEGATEGYAVEFDDPNAITEEEFVQLLLEAGDRAEPVPPNETGRQFYPLMRFLNFTTENGTRYQVNPDRTINQLPDDAPVAISPDGAHVAFLIDDTIAFRYIWTQYSPMDSYIPDYVASLQVPGQAVRFSSDSSFAVVWNTDQLMVVMFSSNRDSGFHLNPVAQVEFASLPDDQLPQVQWSADGTTLVWQDADGIWHWNLYDSTKPVHFDAALADRLLDVSLHGRFLRYGEPTNWTLLDAETGTTYANTLSSPDERFLSAITHEVTGEALAAERECVPPLRKTCRAELDTSSFARDAAVDASTFSYLGNLFGVSLCGPWGESRCYYEGVSWHPAIGDTSWIGGRYLTMFMTDVRQIAYDPQYSQPAILVGDYEIHFGFYRDSWLEEPQNLAYLDILQLENKIDSPIATIEWGQPIFYSEYLLTTMEHFAR